MNSFEREHRRLNARLRVHLLLVVGGDFVAARDALRDWRDDLAHHMEAEETLLFPQIPAGARWNERLYRLEHDRIRLLADEYATLLDDAAARLPLSDEARRVLVLALLDHVHPLRHLLEHHHQREEAALAEELPLELQARAWGT